MSKIKLQTLTLIFSLLFTQSGQGAQSFLNGIEDIPLFKEMRNIDNSLILFDKIDGRYVSTEIRGDYESKEVLNFYDKILPNLGWEKIDSLKYQRSSEILEIIPQKLDNEQSFIFSIFPEK